MYQIIISREKNTQRMSQSVGMGEPLILAVHFAWIGSVA